jgi:hypothetical protein
MIMRGLPFQTAKSERAKERSRRGEEYYDDEEGDGASERPSGIRAPEKQIHTVELKLGEGGAPA